VTFVFRNNTHVTVPYSGTYRISESDALLNDALNVTTPLSDANKIINIPNVLGETDYSDEVSWIASEYFEQHWYCSESPY
jgi:hypothetical protein